MDLLKVIDVYGIEHNIPTAQIRDIRKPSKQDRKYWEMEVDVRQFTEYCIDFGPAPVDTVFTSQRIDELLEDRCNAK